MGNMTLCPCIALNLPLAPAPEIICYSAYYIVSLIIIKVIIITIRNNNDDNLCLSVCLSLYGSFYLCSSLSLSVCVSATLLFPVFCCCFLMQIMRSKKSTYH